MIRQRNGARADQGFTLVELLVALFITAILFAMGYGAVNQAMLHRGDIEEQNQRLLAVQTTMRLMAQDFEQAAPRPVRDAVGGDTWSPAVLSQGAAQGQSEQAALITLTRGGWANPAGIQRTTLQRVSYVLEDKTLRREHSPVLDATQTDQHIRRELLSGVKSIVVRYMDASNVWIEQWPPPGNSAPPNTTGAPQPNPSDRALPLAIEVTLELDDWGKITRIFEIAQ